MDHEASGDSTTQLLGQLLVQLPVEVGIVSADKLRSLLRAEERFLLRIG